MAVRGWMRWGEAELGGVRQGEAELGGVRQGEARRCMPRRGETARQGVVGEVVRGVAMGSDVGKDGAR